MAEDNFDQLSHLRPVLDKDGQPIMSSGNFAVVFNMQERTAESFTLCDASIVNKRGGRREEVSVLLKDWLESDAL